jgi:hypothetical protein
MKLGEVSLAGCLLILGSCAPNIHSDAGMRKLQRVTHRVDTLNFMLESRGVVLWQGVARVTRMQSAELELKGGDASGPICDERGTRRGGSYTAGVRIHKYGGNANDRDSYEFDAWVVNVDLAPNCKDEVSSGDQAHARRTLGVGQEFTFKGNGDLKVTIERVK